MNSALGDADLLDRLFRSALGWRGPAPLVPASHAGIEQEYTLFHSGRKVDFRELVHQLGVPGLRLDPGDRYAYRLGNGAALTCDQEEAEACSPPLAVGAAFTRELSAWSAAGRDQIERLLPDGMELRGCSTHISATMPTRLNDPVAFVFARTFAPLLMLLMGDRGGGGVFVRPRAGRLELCGFHVEGQALELASTVAVGGALACAQAVASGDAGGLPPAVSPRLTNCRSRFGLRVPRDAFGFDLFADPRSALLPGESGTVRLVEQAELAWDAAVRSLEGAVPTDVSAAGARLVGGDEPFPSECARGGVLEPARAAPTVGSPLGRVIRPETRCGFELRALASTWDTTVFRAEADGRAVAVNVPTAVLGRFYEELDAARLDGLILERLEIGGRGRHLTTRRAALAPSFYDAVAPRAILARERPRELDAVRILMSAAEGSGRVPGGAGFAASDEIDTGEARLLKPGILIPRVPELSGSLLPEEPGTGDSSIPGQGRRRWPWILGGGVAVTLAGLGLVTWSLGGGDAGAQPDAEPGGIVSPVPGVASPGGSPATGGSPPADNSPGSAGQGGTTPSGEGSPQVIVSPSPTGPGVVDSPTVAVATTPPGVAPTPTSTPAVAISPTATFTPGPRLSGTRTLTTSVQSNAGDHPLLLPNPLQVNFVMLRDTSVEPNTVQIEVSGGGLPLMRGNTVIGPSFGSNGGSATASGQGTYSGFPTTYAISFVITPAGVTGTITIGGAGLPGGQPLVLSFVGGAPN